MKKEIVKKIAKYGDKFVEKHLIPAFDIGLMLRDWWQGLQYFLHYSFFQGRADIISIKVEKAAMNILKRYITGKSTNALIWLSKGNFAKIRKELKQAIGKRKIGKGRDIDMVISILNFASKLKEKNIVKYSISKIKKGELKSHFYELQTIISIGPKIASLYLRDLVWMYSLERLISKDDLVYLQPVDTWVRKVAFKTGIIDDIKLSDTQVRQKIVEACQNLDISTIKFNQGAWYVGYYAFDIVLENLDKI